MQKIFSRKVVAGALLTFVAPLVCSSADPFTVNSLIVEPYSNDIRYAPVNFAGEGTLVVDDITYHALSETGAEDTSTLSSHAATVRDRLLAADGPYEPIKDIFALSADDYLDEYVKTSSPGETAALPDEYGHDIKVINHSWIASYGDEDYDLDTVRRMDYMIRREDIIMTSGAVSPNPNNPNQETPLVWSSRNAIAVRGIQSFNPDDAVGTRRHADLWGPKKNGEDEAASYETPGVAGYAAALLAEADTQDWSNGQNGMRHEVVKSILMTGADKTDFTSNGFTSWEADLSNNLDSRNGAGRADYEASKNILISGPQEKAAVDNDGKIDSPNITENHSGWWYEENLSADSTQALIIDLAELYLTDLTATLAWDVTQEETEEEVTGPPGTTETRLNTTDDGLIFANLSLEFLEVNEDEGGYSLGDSLNIDSLLSDSEEDNVQHLYLRDDLLFPGLYAFAITNRSDFDWDYGFSFNIIAVPEPGTIILLILGFCLLFHRRAV